MRILYLFLGLLISLPSFAQIDLFSSSLMMEYRDSHQSAYLGLGQAMVAGGWVNGNASASTEIYSAFGNMFSEGTPMNNPRVNFAMHTLNNGYVLAAGGWDGETLNYASTEIYDHDMETWMEGPSLSVGRADLVATELSDGRILFTGGFDGMVNSNAVDIYDPIANTMTTGANMNYGRSAHAAMLLSDGRVLVAGGFNPDFGFQMNQCEIYDPFLDTWTEVASLSTGKDNLTGFGNLSASVDAMVVGGRVFNAGLNLFEGVSDAEIYDVDNDAWVSVSIPQKISYAKGLTPEGAGALPEVLLIAGVDQTGLGVTTTYADKIAFNFDDQTTSVNTNGEGRFLASVCYIATESTMTDLWLVSGGDENGLGTAEVWGDEYLSVDEEEKISWTVFPNPAMDRIVLQGQAISSWELFDARGAKVLSGTTSMLEVAELARGTYSLRVSGTNSVNTLKIVLQ